MIRKASYLNAVSTFFWTSAPFLVRFEQKFALFQSLKNRARVILSNNNVGAVEGRVIKGKMDSN